MTKPRKARTKSSRKATIEHLVRQAEEETDPFMKRLLLFVAAEIAAEEAIKGKNDCC